MDSNEVAEEELCLVNFIFLYKFEILDELEFFHYILVPVYIRQKISIFSLN